MDLKTCIKSLNFYLNKHSFNYFYSHDRSYDSNNLTNPDIKWLGVRPSDLDKYSLPDQCRLPLTDTDRKTGEDLLKEAFTQKSPKWCEEIELMLKAGKKGEIQVLLSLNL